MGLFVVEKNGRKIYGKKNKYIADIKDLPSDEELRASEQELPEVKEVPKYEPVKPVIYEKPKKSLFKKKEKIKKEKSIEITKEEKEVIPEEIINPTASLNNYVSNDSNYERNIRKANNKLLKKEEDTSMYKGKLKTESTIFGICFKTILLTYFRFMIMCAIVVVGYLLLDKYDYFHLELFPFQEIYTVERFNFLNMRAMGILAIITVVISLFAMFAIRRSVKSSLKKKYLSKVNIYIYDVFIALLNVLFFVLIILSMFYLVDNMHSEFLRLVENGKIDGPVNTETIIHFKMFVVVIASAILAISSYFDIELVYKKNKFIFDDSVF